MSRARIVIGANFGDEGKGLLTDYLCSKEGAGMVVRFNGGANAGHTVVTPDGRRHVFSHFGSGTFAGVPTFLSQFFVCNPILFMKEFNELSHKGVAVPTVYAHPDCLVTTFGDMIINQMLEDNKKELRHGSTGIGFNETILRSEISELKITMSDVWARDPKIKDKLEQICGKYSEFRTGRPITNIEHMVEGFVKGLSVFADCIHPLGIAQCKDEDPVFEGSQGLLLDMDNKEFFPHLTRSNTGLKNARMLCNLAGIDEIIPYYVSRTYLTRHGAGPLPGEDEMLSYHDDTNVEHTYQGKIRFASLDENEMIERCVKDADGLKARLVLTHFDQYEPEIRGTLESHGPTRDHVHRGGLN